MKLEPLQSSEVHVWVASLLLADDRVDGLRSELAADEVERAERMHTPALARRFTVARAVLRRLLAGYLAADGWSSRDEGAESLRRAATTLSFVYGARGKPALAPSISPRADISFNLAHSGDVAVYAFAVGRAVGIDIEALRDVEIDGIAKKVFSARECEALQALSHDERRSAFFRIWARKEAYIKACGQGFGYPTRSFSVSHCADGDALIADDSDPDAPRRWRVVALPAAPGFVMALAAEGRAWSWRSFDATPIL